MNKNIAYSLQIRVKNASKEPMYILYADKNHYLCTGTRQVAEGIDASDCGFFYL
jgi:hypothetical protein